MTRRLVDAYRVGDRVRILLDGEWQAGTVVRLDHPGVWVRLEGDGSLWFVTNGRRIERQGVGTS